MSVVGGRNRKTLIESGPYYFYDFVRDGVNASAVDATKCENCGAVQAHTYSHYGQDVLFRITIYKLYFQTQAINYAYIVLRGQYLYSGQQKTAP